MAQYKDGNYIVKDGEIFEVQIDIPRMMGAEVIHVALKDFKKQTNADRIRAMSDEEMAEFLWDEWMDRIICDKMDTKESMLKWLMEEVENG